MSILENLEGIISEISREDVSKMAQEVAVQNVETGRFLNLPIALEIGVPEWTNNASFMMRNKINAEILPQIKATVTKADGGRDTEEINAKKQEFINMVRNKKVKFIDAKELKADLGQYDVGAIDSGEMEQ